MTAMPCDEAGRRLSAYLDGALSRAAARDLDEHLAACARCRDRLAFGRALDRRVKQSLPAAPLPAGLEARVRQAVGRPGPSERAEPRRSLFLDTHHHVAGLTAEGAARAHRRDLEVQDRYGVRYLKYWYDEQTGRIFCLVEAPSREAAEAVHREAHGFVADEIVEVKEGA